MMLRSAERELKFLHREVEIRHDPFVENFNMTLAQPHSKSVRLNGLATCLRLENVYWNILSGIASSNEERSEVAGCFPATESSALFKKRCMSKFAQLSS
ncbi:ribbon-helix-helix domain-containing protein, partial [Pseudomonas syringae]|uniref:ribbon-helix-helix domain-containing protein n=2 Tax=Pseudomonas syringae TaxID=317 RepID=UPI001FF8ACB1